MSRFSHDRVHAPGLAIERPGATRRAAVIAHLTFVVEEIRQVGVFVGDDIVLGSLDHPDDALDVVTFRAEAPRQAASFLAIGESIRVVYAGETDRYDFRTTVAGNTDDGHWMLQIPAVIHPSRNRLTARHLAEGRWHYWVRDLSGNEVARYEVHDISPAGCGLVVPAGARHPLVNLLIDGLLEGPHGNCLSVRLHVRNVRPHPKRVGEKIAGCSFEDLAGTDVRLIAALLARCEMPSEMGLSA